MPETQVWQILQWYAWWGNLFLHNSQWSPFPSPSSTTCKRASSCDTLSAVSFVFLPHNMPPTTLKMKTKFSSGRISSSGTTLNSNTKINITTLAIDHIRKNFVLIRNLKQKNTKLNKRFFQSYIQFFIKNM